MNSEWDKYYYDLCKIVATNSKCLSRKIGSIIVMDKSIISTGYNGPPRGVPQCNKRWSVDDYLHKQLMEKKGSLNSLTEEDLTKCPRYVLGYKSGQGLDICIAGHAERNALINAARHGIAVKGAIMYMDCPISCTPCMIEIINAGISEIVCTDLTYYDKQTEYLIIESEIKVRKYAF